MMNWFLQIVSPEGYVDLEDWNHEENENENEEIGNIRKDSEGDVASNSEDVTTILPNISNNVTPTPQGNYIKLAMRFFIR